MKILKRIGDVYFQEDRKVNFILDLLKLQCPRLFTVPDRVSHIECEEVLKDVDDVLNSFLQGVNEQLLDCMEDIIVSLEFLCIHTCIVDTYRHRVTCCILCMPCLACMLPSYATHTSF